MEVQCVKFYGVEVIVVQVGEEKLQDEVLMMCDVFVKEIFFKVLDYSEFFVIKQKIWDSLCDGKIIFLNLGFLIKFFFL